MQSRGTHNARAQQYFQPSTLNDGTKKLALRWTTTGSSLPSHAPLLSGNFHERAGERGSILHTLSVSPSKQTNKPEGKGGRGRKEGRKEPSGKVCRTSTNSPPDRLESCRMVYATQAKSVASSIPPSTWCIRVTQSHTREVRRGRLHSKTNPNPTGIL